MDKISIVDLEVYCYHGVYETEKTQGQNFLVCAELTIKRDRHAVFDELTFSVDYAGVCNAIHGFMTENTYNLIETAANQLGLFLLKQYPLIFSAKIEVKKPDAPIGLRLRYVSAVCVRSRHTAFLSLGSNLGDSEHMLQNALIQIENNDDCKLLKVSAFQKTCPYGKTDQPDFLNACVEISTVLEPFELLNAVQGIENRLGRVRKEKWGPRTLDIDILFYDDLVLSESGLTIPHADLCNRLFVLEPLCTLEPNLIHPIYKLPVNRLLELLAPPKKQRKVKDAEHKT